jgi:hypothetical protein
MLVHDTSLPSHALRPGAGAAVQTASFLAERGDARPAFAATGSLAGLAGAVTPGIAFGVTATTLFALTRVTPQLDMEQR